MTAVAIGDVEKQRRPKRGTDADGLRPVWRRLDAALQSSHVAQDLYNRTSLFHISRAY